MSAHSLIVNAITFLRVPLIFAWLVCAIFHVFTNCFILGFCALLSMFLAGITDAFDGALARKWNVVSQLGKMADPLMDKVFYVVAFPTLVWILMNRVGESNHALLMLIFAILCILRDFWVTFLRSLGSMFGADVAAMWMGKVRTALLFPLAGFVYTYIWLGVYLPDAWREAWQITCYILEGLMLVLNFVSTLTYTRAYWPYLKKALERH